MRPTDPRPWRRLGLRSWQGSWWRSRCRRPWPRSWQGSWPRSWRPLGWLGWLGIAAAFTARFAGRAGDDVYITYRYAYNLAHGRGLVFNPGERVFGISDPGVAMLLAGLNRATGIAIPTLGTGVTAAALLAIAGLLLAASRAGGRETEGWLGGTLLLASAYVWLGQGAGPLPALALLLAAARAAGARRPWLAGIVAGLAFCCRPDAALGAALLALLLAAESLPQEQEPAAGEARSRRLAAQGEATAANEPRRLAARGGATAANEPRRLATPRSAPSATGASHRAARLVRPLVFAAAFAAVAALALAAAWAYFGTPLPGTLEAKRRFAALAPRDFTGLAFWRPALRYFCAFAGPGGPALLILGAAGQAPLFARAGRPGRLLVLYSLALVAFYTAAAVPFFIWYTIPTAIAVLCGAPFLVGELLRRARGGAARTAGAPRAAGQAAALALAGIGAAVWLSALAAGGRWWRHGDTGDWRLFAYSRAGEWIHDHTAPGADVAADEVGILGYHSDRPILDLIGLVTPRARPFAAVGDPLGAFLAKPTELVLFHTYDRRGGTRPILFRPWFAGAYRLAAAIPDPAAGAETRIYQRRDGAAIPPPRPPWPRVSHR